MLLELNDLHTYFTTKRGIVKAVNGVSYSVEAGKTLGVVGESGCGKSVSAMSILRLLDGNGYIESGSITFKGQELTTLEEKQMYAIRGNAISVIFQEPMTSLNPVFTIERQISEAFMVHQAMDKKEAARESVRMLADVKIPNPEEVAKQYPHQLSGGMRQRVMIAMAIANNPDLIIADEPTTALDVTIQAQILDVLRTAQKETDAGVIMITHDLGVIAGIADRVAVMYAGRVVEQGDVNDIFYHTAMPYTIGLLGSLPRLDERKETALASVEGNPPSMLIEPTGCPFAARCPIVKDECLNGEPALERTTESNHSAACVRAKEIRQGNLHFSDIYPAPKAVAPPFAGVDRFDRKEVLRISGVKKSFPLMKGAVFKRQVGWVHAVDGISLDIREGETLGLVGESGCGKTTTLMQVLDLVPPQEGTVVVMGESVAEMSKKDRRRVRGEMQIVFQDPMASLDPRMPIFDIIAEPLKHNGWPKQDISRRVEELMSLVGLEPAHANRYPRHFSGGQKQRVGIARALALEPKLLILDEPVAALDVSIQAGVINLLDELRSTLKLSYLFVAHDLSVIRHIADRVAVMYLGKIVETGDVDSVFEAPRHPYTQALLSAIPIPDPEKERSRHRVILKGDLPSPANPPKGCRFVTRCPVYEGLNAEEKKRCEGSHPDLVSEAKDHDVACYYPRVLQII